MRQLIEGLAVYGAVAHEHVDGLDRRAQQLAILDLGHPGVQVLDQQRARVGERRDDKWPSPQRSC